jgi:hypothetical protein
LLRSRKHVAKERCAKLGARHLRNCNQAVSRANLGDTFVSTEEHYLDFRVKPEPAIDGISLLDSGPAPERLGRAKKSDHREGPSQTSMRRNNII